MWDSGDRDDTNLCHQPCCSCPLPCPRRRCWSSPSFPSSVPADPSWPVQPARSFGLPGEAQANRGRVSYGPDGLALGTGLATITFSWLCLQNQDQTSPGLKRSFPSFSFFQRGSRPLCPHSTMFNGTVNMGCPWPNLVRSVSYSRPASKVTGILGTEWVSDKQFWVEFKGVTLVTYPVPNTSRSQEAL